MFSLWRRIKAWWYYDPVLDWIIRTTPHEQITLIVTKAKENEE